MKTFMSVMRALAVVSSLLYGCAAAHHEPAVRGLPRDDPDATLSVVWVGHATVLIRLGHRFVLTDPNLGGSLWIQPRVTPASLTPEELPPVQLVLLSHLHIDHFDTWTLNRMPASTEVVFPPGADSYMSAIRQVTKESLPFGQTLERGGVKITSVPVMHAGGRYLIDALWNKSFAGYIIEADGKRIFFAGDTGYDKTAFIEIGKRFPGIDLALIPIAPAKGGNVNHADPKEALDIFRDVGARYMIPIHFEAYASMAVPYEQPRAELLAEAKKRHLEDRVFALYTGERFIVPDSGGPPRVTREK
jgi:N-acyl-phosphatidylethanolamine-hydrolysing phospholipase D